MPYSVNSAIFKMAAVDSLDYINWSPDVITSWVFAMYFSSFKYYWDVFKYKYKILPATNIQIQIQIQILKKVFKYD